MPSVEGDCTNLVARQFYIPIPDVLCSLAVFSLPIPRLLKLHIDGYQKFMLLVALLVGLCSVGSGFYHFWVLLKFTPTDMSYTLADVYTWRVIELFCGIVAGSLPVLVSKVQFCHSLTPPSPNPSPCYVHVHIRPKVHLLSANHMSKNKTGATNQRSPPQRHLLLARRAPSQPPGPLCHALSGQQPRPGLGH
jgi:hypothetical protein